MNIREAQPPGDFERITAIVNEGSIDPLTLTNLIDDENRIVTGKIHRRWVAVDVNGLIVGYAYAVKYPSQPTGHFDVTVHVDSAYQCQGIGAALYATTEQFAREYGAILLTCNVLERLSDSARFAQQHGFKVRIHEIGLHLDLATFDVRPVADWVRRVEAQGIQITTLTDVGNTLENQNKLYEINRIAALDDPAANSDQFMTLENWRRVIAGASWFQPQGQIIACDMSRNDLYIGMSGITYDKDTNTAGTTLTGVHPDYRRRGVAQALKLRAVEFAQQYGAATITTTCDARNTGMIAINCALGFVTRPGFYQLTKPLT